MPWKQGYTISDEISLSDKDLHWPDDSRCCLSITVDLSVARGPEGIRPADLQTADAFFALNDGLDQILSVLQRHKFKATFAVPAVMAEICAGLLPDLIARGHE